MPEGPSKKLLRTAAVVVAGVLAAHCGGGEPPLHVIPNNSDAGFGISGYAVKGPISGGTVTAYQLLPDMTRGEQLATTTTDDSGFFGLSLPAFSGDVLLVVNGGSYVEEALNDVGDGGPSPFVTVNVDYVGLVIGYQAGQPATANVTPISHLAYALATYHVQSLGEPVDKAVAAAFIHLGAHFGNIPGVSTDLDWLTVVPSGLGVGDGAQLTAPQRAGLVLAGLSQLAASISSRAGISPGGEANALSLLTTLSEDVGADGFFDGLGTGGRQLVLPAADALSVSGPTATALDGSTVRSALASGIANFVASSSNVSTITIPDTTGITGALSADSDPYLFKTPGTPFDVTPPLLTVVSAPPPYTNQVSVSFTVQADVGANAAGVKVVVVRTGDGTLLNGVNTSGNLWTFSDVLTGGANPYFDVWGVDNANNSGEEFPVGPYHLRLPCLQDVGATRHRSRFQRPQLPRRTRHATGEQCHSTAIHLACESTGCCWTRTRGGHLEVVPDSFLGHSPANGRQSREFQFHQCALYPGGHPIRREYRRTHRLGHLRHRCAGRDDVDRSSHSGPKDASRDSLLRPTLRGGDNPRARLRLHESCGVPSLGHRNGRRWQFHDQPTRNFDVQLVPLSHHWSSPLCGAGRQLPKRR